MSFCPKSDLLLLVFYICLTSCDQGVIEVSLPLPPIIEQIGPLTETDGLLIRWRSNRSLDLDSYCIYRTSAGREQILLAKIGQNQTRWEDEAAPLEVESIYRVASVNIDQQQGHLSEPVAYTLIRKPAPVAPKDQTKLEHHPTFRWLGTDQLGGYSLRLFVHDEEDVLNSVSPDSIPQTPYREIWRYETIDFERFSVDFNLDQAATENLMEGKLYRWRIDFSAGENVGSYSKWRFFRFTG